jgi:hypothetical protein
MLNVPYMSGGAYWTENVIPLVLRTHHCWEKESFQNSLNKFKRT